MLDTEKKQKCRGGHHNDTRQTHLTWQYTVVGLGRVYKYGAAYIGRKKKPYSWWDHVELREAFLHEENDNWSFSSITFKYISDVSFLVKSLNRD